MAGPTGSGKTSFLKNLLELKNDKDIPMPRKVLWCSFQWQPLYATMKDVEFGQGLPDVEKLKSCLLLLNDMMDCLESEVTDLFTKGSHKNIPVIAVTQNVFHQSRFQRTISLNISLYMVLFKNPRDASEI